MLEFVVVCHFVYLFTYIYLHINLFFVYSIISLISQDKICGGKHLWPI
jgi:hypothetical protein